MIQYIVILLDDTSVSFCHYANNKTERRLMSLETLKTAVMYSMKENLNVQFVYPDYELPKEHLEIIDCIDHVDIKPVECGKGEVQVINGFAKDVEWQEGIAYVLRTDKAKLFDNGETLKDILSKVYRLSVVITDVEDFTDNDFADYRKLLEKLGEDVEKMYVGNHPVQLNILTDRMMLTEMNNCGAGDTTITVAPDGMFYVCPAFYYAGTCDGKEQTADEVCQKGYSIGSLSKGLDIKNPQLYKLDHAPICRHCDAWQCKRCIWLNRKTTLEVNTPSHEQCVVAHLERNASRNLLDNIRNHGTFLPEKKEIKEIDYLDPFDKREEW